MSLHSSPVTPHRLRSRAWAGSLLAATLALSGCAGGGSQATAAVTQAPESPTLLATDDASELAIQASTTWFSEAGYVVVADPGDQAAINRAASIGAAAGVPVLLGEESPAEGSPVDQELERLGTEAVVTVGAVDPATMVEQIAVAPAPTEAGALGDLVGADVTEVEPEGDPVRQLTTLEPGQVLAAPDGAPTGAERGDFPRTQQTERTEGAAAVSDGSEAQAAAIGTARAAGAVVSISPQVAGGTSEAVDALADTQSVVGLGTSYGDPATFNWGVRAAQTGVQLPGGGQQVFGGKRYIALYGSPMTESLGLLGEQGTEETVARAKEMAAPYEELTEDQVLPAQEIIVTVASSVAGPDNNYSTEFDSAEFIPLIEAASEAGQYVVIDFQSGRSDFVSQIKMYEDLLRYPHVGVALDPEWRLGPDEVHLRQIGQVSGAEVNEVSEYLAGFVTENDLPPKLMVLHQFQTRMITERDTIITDRPQVPVLIHADGQGTQPEKQATWQALHNGAPEGIYWGWKNFLDEDSPMLTPEQTYDQVDPVPEFVSYQ